MSNKENDNDKDLIGKFQKVIEDQRVASAASVKIVEFANQLGLTQDQVVGALATATGIEVAFNLAGTTRLSGTLGVLCNAMEDASSLLFMISTCSDQDMDSAADMAAKATGKTANQVKAFGKSAKKIMKSGPEPLDPEQTIMQEQKKGVAN